jgi:hypothetical protein
MPTLSSALFLGGCGALAAGVLFRSSNLIGVGLIAIGVLIIVEVF